MSPRSRAESAQTPAPLIDLQTDRLIAVQDLCQQRLGKRVSPPTVWRWIHRGTAGGKLEAVYVSATWYTTAEAFADFLQRMTAAKLRPAEQDGEPPAERPHATEQALRKRKLIR